MADGSQPPALARAHAKFPQLTEDHRVGILARLDAASAFWAAAAREALDDARTATLARDFDRAQTLGRKVDRLTALISTVRLACRPEYLSPLWRWAWLRKLSLLGDEETGVRNLIEQWHDAGQPDGLDCCPQCGSTKWRPETHEKCQAVHGRGLVATGELVNFYRCGDCMHSEQLLDITA